MTGTITIRQSEIEAAQRSWADGILGIRGVYREGGDYTEAARTFIQHHYAYDLLTVLFKPTLASRRQFRLTETAALSYFVGGNPDYPEDAGFAIQPWVSIRVAPVGFHCFDACATSMGNYFLMTEDDRIVKAEFTFGYIRDEAGELRISLHHSSLPYAPPTQD